MPAKNHLTLEQIVKLKNALRQEENAAIRERVLILLLLNDGKTQVKIAEFLGCSSRLFKSVEALEFLLYRLLNEGELVIEWGRKLKNKGNAAIPV